MNHRSGMGILDTFMRKNRKMLKRAKWAFIIGAAADISAVGAGYYFYYQMKNSRDFRYKVYNYDPRYVDLYYRANEKYGDGKARKNDYQEWDIQKVDSFSFAHLFGL